MVFVKDIILDTILPAASSRTIVYFLLNADSLLFGRTDKHLIEYIEVFLCFYLRKIVVEQIRKIKLFLRNKCLYL